MIKLKKLTMVSETTYPPIVDLLFSIFRDTTRRRVLYLLNNMKLTADEITKELGISRPAVEKHLKQMLDVGLIERRAETFPTLKYLYSLPAHGIEIVSNLEDAIDQYITSLKEEYSRRLENEEQLFLLGHSSKDKYEAIKVSYNHILEKLQSE